MARNTKPAPGKGIKLLGDASSSLAKAEEGMDGGDFLKMPFDRAKKRESKAPIAKAKKAAKKIAKAAPAAKKAVAKRSAKDRLASARF